MLQALAGLDIRQCLAFAGREVFQQQVDRSVFVTADVKTADDIATGVVPVVFQAGIDGQQLRVAAVLTLETGDEQAVAVCRHFYKINHMIRQSLQCFDQIIVCRVRIFIRDHAVVTRTFRKDFIAGFEFPRP